MTDLIEHSQRELGQLGMAEAAEHAERVNEGWKREAGGYLHWFAMDNRGRDFLAEEVAPWAYERGCSRPPDDRAWGAIFQKASRSGVIEQTGFAAKNKLSGHNSRWSALWRTGDAA